MRLSLRTIAARMLALLAMSLFFVGASDDESSGGGCSGSDGEDGPVYVMYLRDGSVSSVNLTSLGLPVNPSQYTEYEAYAGSATIAWDVGGNDYAAEINLPPRPGSEGKCETNLLIFRSCTDGEDGGPRTFLLQFSGGTVNLSILDQVYQGTQL